MNDLTDPLHQAEMLHRAGRLAEAESRYREVLGHGNASAQAYFLHGVCCQSLGRAVEAVESLRRAATIQPNHAAAHHHLGVLLAQQGATVAAIESLQQAQRLRPDDAEIAANLRFVAADLENRGAMMHSERGQLADAAESLRRVVALVPDDADAHYNLGHVLSRQGLWSEAGPHFRRATELRPDHAAAQLQFANALFAQEQFAEAAAGYRRALTLVPDNPHALTNLGNALLRLGQLGEAIQAHRRAVAIAPDNAEAHNNLGVALAEEKQHDEALACYAEALRLRPDYFDACMNRATVLVLQDRLGEALALYERALQLNPGHRQSLFNVGFIRAEQNQLDEALACYDQIVRHDPSDADAHYHRAMTLLALGRASEGWPEYEWRWRRPGKAERPLPQPRWNGAALAGQTILLWTEQGYGDSLQFIRYARLLKQQGAAVVVDCEPRLASLCEHCDGVDRVVTTGQSFPPYDVHAPLLSLPLLCREFDPEHVSDGPYFHPAAQKVDAWRRTIGGAGLRVGISWRGNPANPMDARRSVPLEYFAPLARAPGVRLFSLQVDGGREELDRVANDWPIIDLAPQLANFHEAAAAMVNLDLVVTCDSAPAHLAGALGRSVWLALAHAPDWRWMLDRTDSPWYPTMRLFRQPQRGDWASVFAEIARALAALT
ncbi:MAG: tetratricopeptide repeat protein [Pirellulales bacterium]